MAAKKTLRKITLLTDLDGNSAIYIDNKLLLEDVDYAFAEDLLNALCTELIFEYTCQDLDKSMDNFPQNLQEAMLNNIWQDAQELENTLLSTYSSVSSLGVENNIFVIYGTSSSTGYFSELLKNGYRGRKVIFKKTTKALK